MIGSDSQQQASSNYIQASSREISSQEQADYPQPGEIGRINTFSPSTNISSIKKVLIYGSMILLVVAFAVIGFPHQKESFNARLQPEEIKAVPPTTRKGFTIPKHVWVIQQEPKNYLHARCFENIKYYSKISGYELHFISESNYHEFLDNARSQRLKSALEKLKKMNLLAKDEQNIKNYLILVNAVNDNGGLMVHRGPFAFIEDFGWIQNISRSHLKLGKSRGIVPQVIAFYHAQITDNRTRFNIEPFYGMEEIDKILPQFPALQQIFFAALKKTEYLTALIEKLYYLIANHHLYESIQKQYQFKPNIQFPRSLVFTANHIVLKDKQKDIDLLSSKDSYKLFAYDYYGIYFLNSNHGPYKLRTFYQFWRPRVKPFYSGYHDFARYRLEDFYQYSGQIRFFTRLYHQEQMTNYLQASAHGKDITIYHGSLLQKLYYPEGYYPFVVDNPQKSFTNLTNKQWETFPKKMWLYWSQGFQKSGAFVQMCMNNLKRFAQATGFEVFLVTDQNIHKYIPRDELILINTTLRKNSKVTVQSFSDLYRLTLVYHNGGMYFDASSFAIENFDWILNIGKFPSQFIFNRFGQNPRVLLSFHPSEGMPGTWKITDISKDHSVKTQWYQGIESSFLAGEQYSQLLKQWRDLLLQTINNPYEVNFKILQDCGVDEFSWIEKKSQYLLVMDTAKCVLGRRQQMLEEDPDNKWINAAHYYGLWTFNTYLANTKLRYNRNYQNPKTIYNAYFIHYPLDYVDQVVGKTKFFFKLFKDQKYHLETKFFDKYPECNFEDVSHSKSIFRQFLWDQKLKPLFIEEQRLKKVAIQTKQKEESDRRKNEEQQRQKRAQEEKKKRQEQEKQKRQKAQEEKKKKEEEQKQKQQKIEDERKKVQSEKQKQKQRKDEEERKKRVEEQKQKQQKIQEQRKKQEQKKQKQQNAEEEKKKKEDEQKNKQQKALDERKKQEQENQRQKVAQEEKKKKQDEQKQRNDEVEKKKKEEHEKQQLQKNELIKNPPI